MIGEGGRKGEIDSPLTALATDMFTPVEAIYHCAGRRRSDPLAMAAAGDVPAARGEVDSEDN